MISLEELFCNIDDFCQHVEPQWRASLLGQGVEQRVRSRALSLSEIMTILVAFHQQHYRNFKAYYLQHVSVYWKEAFPSLVSYNRFVEWMPSTLLPLCIYLKHCFGSVLALLFIDATSLKVCHHRRSPRPKSVFQSGSKRQNLSRLVLWLQAASGSQ